MPRVTFEKAFVFAPHPRVRQSFKPGGSYMVTQAAAEAAAQAGALAGRTPPAAKDGESDDTAGKRGRRAAD